MASAIEDKVSHDRREDVIEKTGLSNVKRTASGLKLEPQPSDEPAGRFLETDAIIFCA